MIESISLRLAWGIKKRSTTGVGVEVMAYALSYHLNTAAIFFLTCLGGIITGHLFESMLSLAAFAALRYFSGGIHLNSLDACTLFSSGVFILSPLVHLDNKTIIAVLVISLVLVLTNPKKPLKNKLISTILELSNLFLLSSTLGVTFLVQAVTLLQFKDADKLEDDGQVI